MKKQLIFSLLAFVLLLVVWFLLLGAVPTGAQSGVTYYVYEQDGQCWQLDPEVDSLIAELDPLEWFEYETFTEGNHVLTVCASDGVSHTIEYDTIYGYGYGGFQIAWDMSIKVDTAEEYIDRDQDTYAPSPAACYAADGEINGVAESDLSGMAGGWNLRSNLVVNNSFCEDEQFTHYIIRFRAWGYGDIPTPTPSPTAYPTSTPSPCSDGYVYDNGQCVEPACVGVSCDAGDVCIDGACVAEDDLPSRMDAYVCINNDPGLNDPGQWFTTGTWPDGYGYVRLRGGDYVRAASDWQFEGGPLRFVISARTCNYPALTYPLYSGTGNQYDWYIENDCNWNLWSIIKTFPVQTSVNLGLLVDEAFSDEVLGVDVDYICVYPYEYPTATPTPTPSPTARPTRQCSNPDPDFMVPSLWTLNGGAYIAGADNLYLPPGASASINASDQLDPGAYHIFVSGVAQANGISTQISYDNWSDWVNWSQDNMYYEWDAIIPSSGTDLTIMAPGTMPDTIIIGMVCLLRIGDAPPTATPYPTTTPQPTQTPGGATATATSTAGPPTATPGTGGQGYCLNDDPNLDAAVWQVSGGTITNGVADILPGGTLFAAIDSDEDAAYYVHIVAMAGSAEQAILNWRGRRVPFYVSTEYGQITLNFPRSTVQQLVAPEHRQLHADPFVSPLSIEQLPFVSPLQSPAMQVASSGILVIENPSTNSAHIYVESVCVTADTSGGEGDAPGDLYDVDVVYPVCDADYVIQTAFNATDGQYAMRIGPGERPGMPVHAILPGTTVIYGEYLSFDFGGVVYDHCTVFEHSALLNVTVQTVYCGLSEFKIPESGVVKQGQLIGYAGATSDYLLTFALQVDDEWVDPDLYLEMYPDCYPYSIVFEEVARCGSDDGTELIPPRYNDPFPGWRLASIPEYLPWLVRTLYDFIGYPILCALVPLFNFVVGMIVTAANALLAALSPVFIFLYRISRLFEYVLDLFLYAFNQMLHIVTGMADLLFCGRQILRYFGEAIAAGAEGQTDLENIFANDTVLFGIVAVSQLLLQSRVASLIMTPLCVVFIGYSAYIVLPWGFRQIRKASGLGE